MTDEKKRENRLPDNDLALRAYRMGQVQLALDILTTGTGRSKGDALLLLHRSNSKEG